MRRQAAGLDDAREQVRIKRQTVAADISLSPPDIAQITFHAGGLAAHAASPKPSK